MPSNTEDCEYLFTESHPIDSLAAEVGRTVFTTNNRIKEAFKFNNEAQQFSFLGEHNRSVNLLLHMDVSQYTMVRDEEFKLMKIKASSHFGNLSKEEVHPIVKDLLRKNTFAKSLFYEVFVARSRNNEEKNASYSQGRCGATSMFFLDLLAKDIPISQDYKNLDSRKARASFGKFLTS